MQAAIALLAGLLTVLYWFVYRASHLRAQALDEPVATSWKQLVVAAQTNVYVRSLEPSALEEAARQMARAADWLEQAGQAAAARCAWDETVRQRLQGPFQLLEFDRQRFLTMAELRTRAMEAKVHIADRVWEGYPDYDPGLVPASLHWGLLATAQQALATAVACQVGAISNLAVLPTLSFAAEESGPPAWHLFRIRLELAGPAPSLERFLRSLPLRLEEWSAAGLPAVPGKTQALFLDRLLLKNLRANPDITGLDVVVSAFCEHPRSPNEP
ncbi:MAG: hypothetical protein RMN51_09730 [Verrucomicrobiota bacterium]|nr:hypothetical protein [Limisphaera sp.]MDW8382370.1 hypothetical protein [Verrucomicrobiota bacterium]